MHLVKRFALGTAILDLAVPDVLVTCPILEADSDNGGDSDVPSL